MVSKDQRDSEKTTRLNNRKSIVVAQHLCVGDVITREHLAIKRPGSGIPPKCLEQVIGRVVNKELQVDDVLQWGDC